MSLVFRASTNVSFSDNNHILKFFIKGFENLPSRLFFNSENLCMGSFIQTFKTRWQVIMPSSPHERVYKKENSIYFFFLFIFFIIVIFFIIIIIIIIVIIIVIIIITIITIIIIIIIILFKFFTLFSK